MLRLYNTRTKQIEDFKPLRDKQVGMYSCGPTVYNYAHLGNLRAYIFVDVLKRTLRYLGYDVLHVINITDVGHLASDGDEGEDKVEREAEAEHKSAKEITDFYSRAFFNDLEALNIETKNVLFPRATEYIAEQIALIQTLEKNGFTYKTSDGIYFDSSKFEEYGKLGGIDIQGLEEGARIGKNPEKKHPTDFALWKFSPKNEKRQQEWDSPWGVGFPGWHIECSAMSMKLLGETVDIHTGGIDHIPVHHNNEIAQSESATGKPFVRYWLHNEFVNISGGDKMSKSKKNFLRLESLIDMGFEPIVFRYYMLSAHYRSPINFSFEGLEAAKRGFENLVEKLQGSSDTGKINPAYKKLFVEALENNINTPEALAVVWNLLNDPDVSESDKKKTILEFDTVLGLNLKKFTGPLRIPKKVQELVDKREAARARNDWKTSDTIRAEIETLGYKILDTDKGPRIQKIK